MSQRMLPHTVRIKRKRQDEPVETLHVHYTPQQQKQDDPKKRRFTLDQPASSHPAEFRRVLQDPAASSVVADGATSSLAAAGPTTVSPGPAAVPAAADSALPTTATTTTTTAPLSLHPSSSISDRKILAPATATRRFHLSTKSAPSRSSSPGGGSLQKRKNVATLVESKPKKTRTATAAGAAESSNNSSQDVEMQVDNHDEPGVRPQQPTTTLKRPGRTARSASPAIGGRGVKNGAGATTTSSSAPAATANNNNTNKSGNGGSAPVDPGLLSEMQKFAQEVEHAEQRGRAAAPSTPSKPTPIYPPGMAATPPSHQKLKFQPKATPRFRDRHPERFSSANNGSNGGAAADGMDIDGKNGKNESDSDSDGEYVYDTYIRYDGPPAAADAAIDNVPAATTGPSSSSSLPQDIGILVIDVEQQPLWEAYLEADPAGGAGDSDKEFDTDDEDENAEDFYANEYPEDEVASDDERDEGAYAYRVAASDEEEWGVYYSDEEDLGRPWGRRPAWLKGGNGYGDAGSESD